MKYEIEYTDTIGGQANYSWVYRSTIQMPELTHFGYDGGTNYAKARKIFRRELLRKAKRRFGLSGVRGVTYEQGGMIEFRPYRLCTVLFVIASYDE